jgi:hypothetical protein
MSDPSPPSTTSAAEMPGHKRGLAPLGALLIAVVVAMAALAIMGARKHAITQA